MVNVFSARNFTLAESVVLVSHRLELPAGGGWGGGGRLLYMYTVLTHFSVVLFSLLTIRSIER